MRDWQALVRNRLGPLQLRAEVEAGLVEELATHLEDRYTELINGGAGEPDAYRTAMAELDDVYPLKAALRAPQRRPPQETIVAGDARGGNLVDDLVRDLRYAFRTIRKSPVFATFVVGTLALGIGANTTVFTIINTLVLNPLPVRDTGALKAVSAIETKDASRAPFPISYPDWKDFRDRARAFESFAGYTSNRVVTLQGSGVPERLFAELTTFNYFTTLGLAPARGRFFLPEEDRPGATPVAVMSYGTWTARFAGREDIVGRTVRLNGTVFTVVGVAPAHFIGVNAIFGPDFWLPVSTAPAVLPNEMRDTLTDRGKALLTGIARMKPGVSQAQAQSELDSIASALAREHPAAHEGHSVSVRPVADVLFGSSGGGISNTRPVMVASIVLMGVVAIVLLIACSNVANLLLARSAARRQEIAIRLALGASRRRLVRQLLTESIVLGLLSGAVGLFIGYEGLRVLFGQLPSAANFAAPKLDATVFAFAVFVSLATAFVFGAAPAFQSSRSDVAETLKEEARTTGRNTRRVTLANALVVGQVAFSFVLLVLAALFLRSLGRAYAMDPGFQTSHLAVFMASPAQDGYSKPQTQACYRDVRNRLGSLPGVESVSWASNLPLWARPVNGVDLEGRERRSESDRLRAIVTTVDAGYFRTAGVRLLAGRDFASMDDADAPPVAIVNEKMARDYWRGDAIGKRIQLPGEERMRQVVGVARNANYTNWGEAPQDCVYVPLEQNYSDAMTLFVRTGGDPRDIIEPVKREVSAVAPPILLSFIRTGNDIVEGGLFQAKMAVGLLTAFGLLALGLASIGLYGILAYSVRQRRREIGVRMALGATPSRVQKLVLRDGLRLVGVGVAAGAVVAIGVARLLTGVLFGVSAADPASIGIAVAALSLIALVACYLPARSATRVDPITALHAS